MKLLIIDTVFVYGRNFLDMEFELIKTHPGMGAQLLRRFSSTSKYAEVAPWLTELFSRAEVREDIKCLLSENRNLVYRSTYELLKTVHEKERADDMGGGITAIKD